jgi:hypothetical protein
MSKRIIFIKVISFVAIFSLIFSYLTTIFQPIDRVSFSINRSFYAQPPHSIDVAYIGASSFMSEIHPLTIWKVSGVTGYVRAIAGNPLLMYYYSLEEFFEYQTPQLVVLDPGKLFPEPYLEDFEVSVRRELDPMKFSVVKLQAMQEALSHSQTQTIPDTLFPLLRFHSTWSTLGEMNFDLNNGKEYDYSKGSRLFYSFKEVKFPKNFMKNPGKGVPIQAYNQEALRYYIKMIELCRKKGVKILFVTTPKTNWSLASHNAVQNFADQFGIDYLDYNLPENMQLLNLDLNKDFWDPNHLSSTGAIKLSKNLGAYLQAKYHFPNKSALDAYAQWNVDLRLFKQNYATKK